MNATLTLDAVATAGDAGIVTAMDRGDDSSLMQRYSRGDMAAFTMLYERHKGALYRYLLRLTKRRDVADDLFQEVWARVVASRARYQPLARFSTFLFSIAHNCFIDFCRRSASSPTARALDVEEHGEALAESEHRGPERVAQSEQVAERLRSALENLPEEQREAFLLHEEGGLSLQEIADLTRVGMETAKSRLRYALAKLRQSLAKEREAAEPAITVAGAPWHTR